MPRLARPGIAALALALAVLAEWEMWRPGWYTFKEPLYGIAFALVVLVTLDRERAGKPTAVTAIGRRLAGVGAYSYSLYLLHRPIQFFFEPSVGRVAAAGFLGLEPLTASLLLMTATTPLVLMAARIFHRYCEAPCVAIAQRVGPRRGRRSASTIPRPASPASIRWPEPRGSRRTIRRQSCPDEPERRPAVARVSAAPPPVSLPDGATVSLPYPSTSPGEPTMPTSSFASSSRRRLVAALLTAILLVSVTNAGASPPANDGCANATRR